MTKVLIDFGRRKSGSYLLRTAVWLYALHQFWSFIDRKIPVEEIEQSSDWPAKGGDRSSDEAAGKENESVSDEEPVIPVDLPEDAIFIPLWFAKAEPQIFYKGSDPEWQAYQKFSRDKHRQKSIRCKGT